VAITMRTDPAILAVSPDHTSVSLAGPGGRPRDDEIDLFGITHRGHVRKTNQDHFLLAMVHPQIEVMGTSLPSDCPLPLRGTRLGTVLLVADGVGGAVDGAEASRLATLAIAEYVASSFRSYHAAGAGRDEEFLASLREAALQAHDRVRAESVANGLGTMATTLTLGIGVWPWLYVVQVGDSRAYIYTRGALHQITRDQTLAQDLVDSGAIPAEERDKSPMSHILVSAIGSEEATPVVSRVDVSERGCVLMFCSDGLTKHVTDDEIAAHCVAMRGAEQLSRELLQLALDRGGSDNITIVVARAPIGST
jgi:serine/threonine protein phosphatase PrpC